MKGSSLQFDNLSEAESVALSPDKDENVYSFLNQRSLAMLEQLNEEDVKLPDPFLRNELETIYEF